MPQWNQIDQTKQRLQMDRQHHRLPIDDGALWMEMEIVADFCMGFVWATRQLVVVEMVSGVAQTSFVEFLGNDECGQIVSQSALEIEMVPENGRNY